MKVKECNLRKVLSCDKNQSVFEVARILRESNERHIIVKDNENPVGIVSTTDINNRLVAEGKDSKKTKAQEIMTKEIMTEDSESPLGKVYFDMLKRNIFSCPIVEKGKLIGVLDMKEAMNQLVKEKSNEH